MLFLQRAKRILRLDIPPRRHIIKTEKQNPHYVWFSLREQKVTSIHVKSCLDHVACSNIWLLQCFRQSLKQVTFISEAFQ